MSFIDRVGNSFLDIFTNKVVIREDDFVSSSNPLYTQVWKTNQTAVLAPIQTRIAVDVANVDIRHVDIETESGRFLKTRHLSELNDRLTLQANIDQSGVAMIQDAVATMLEHGVCAIVPIETKDDLMSGAILDVISMRVGKVVGWHNRSVEIQIWNEWVGEHVTVDLPKSRVALCYNPLFSVMNAQNSTLSRLINKLALLDLTDNKINSPNLDLILQLPYAVSGDKKKAEATKRLQNLVDQLYDSAYGIAYLGSTEKITQLNRPVSNNLVEQVSALKEDLYNQLGLSPGVFSGTASPEEMLSYYNRTVSPMLTALIGPMTNTFLTRTGMRQGQRVMAFPSLFKMAPIETLADAADKFTRNEIMTSNEIRSELGLAPAKDKDADVLRNKNLNKSEGSPTKTESKPEDTEPEEVR